MSSWMNEAQAGAPMAQLRQAAAEPQADEQNAGMAETDEEDSE
jgi:hypothetical protein